MDAVFQQTAAAGRIGVSDDITYSVRFTASEEGLLVHSSALNVNKSSSSRNLKPDASYFLITVRVSNMLRFTTACPPGSFTS
ncbi:hypothetical protein QSH57_004214 [Fusarium oxysporum f. sp. vasinfectum]|nr:hypothetical protein QSH57_004214 [Fusarium oxysporum f. sp. vasinfectum]